MAVRRVGLLLVGWVLLAGAVTAQSRDDAAGLLRAMQDAYERLDYATAEQRAREALAAYDAFSADQLVQIHTTLGLILYADSEPLEAEEQFAAALSLDPALTLDPVLVSPKTLEFFEAVRERHDPAGPARREAAVRYVRVRDLRPGATLRSLAVPGWGQLYKGERTKGWVLAGAWSALAGGATAAHVLRSRARQDYLDATDPADIAASYDTFNAWHRARSGLALGTVVVWSYAVLDALVFESREASSAASGLSVEPAAIPDGIGVQVRWSF